jgi:hypothetical protein
MKKFTLISLLLIGCLALNSANATVTVIVEQQQFVFENEPSLADVLGPLAGQQNWYWPAAALYKTGDNSLERKRRGVLRQLLTLARNQTHKDSRLPIEHLAADINRWRLGRRLPVTIDYDLARNRTEANPQFTEGKYILRLAPRSHVVNVLGAVNDSQQIAHQPHGDVSEYVSPQSLSNLADKDILILIQADGREITVPAAYWNGVHQEAMPGSQIFVPFKENLFSPEISELNQQIINLAVNRVL